MTKIHHPSLALPNCKQMQDLKPDDLFGRVERSEGRVTFDLVFATKLAGVKGVCRGSTTIFGVE